MGRVALPLFGATPEAVPVGTPPTVKVTAPEFPAAFAVIFAGVPSCGASAMELESERLSVPVVLPEPAEPHAAATRLRGLRQESAAFCRMWITRQFRIRFPRLSDHRSVPGNR